MMGFYVGMIIMGLFGWFCAVLGIYMAVTGKGAFLIAGYNTMSKTEQARYNATALCKFMGKFIMVVGLATVLLAIGLILVEMCSISFLFAWAIIIAYAVIVTGLSVFTAIYCNTGSRFRR